MMKKSIGKLALAAALAVLVSFSGCSLLPGPNAVMVLVTLINTETGWTINAILTDDGDPLTDAVVHINADAIPETVPGTSGEYFLASAGSLAAQASLTLTVTKPGTEIDISQTLTLPAKVTIISPAEDAYITATADTPFSWTAATPAPFQLVFGIVDGPYMTTPGDYSAPLATSATGHSLPADTLVASYAGDIPVNVASILLYVLAGQDFEIGSNWQLMDIATVNIHTNP